MALCRWVVRASLAVFVHAMFVSAVFVSAVFVSAVFVSAVPAQETFAVLFARAQAVGPGPAAARRQAYLRAFGAFGQLPVGSAAYLEALPHGGLSALRGGQFAVAVDLLAEQWRRRGGSDELLGWRLQALIQAGRGGAAIELGRRLQAAHGAGLRSFFANPANFGALMTTGDQLLLSGNTAAGVFVFTTLQRVYPEDPGVMANLALTYRRLGRLRAAAKSYQAALRRGPKLAWLWTDYGLLRKGQGQTKQAAAAFIAALSHEENAGDSPAGTNLAVLALRTGENHGRRPIEDLQAVVRRRPRAAMARRLLLDLLVRKVR